LLAASEHDEREASMPEGEPEHLETVIIGGGQAGLSVGRHLARRGRPFLILDTNRRVGDAWRKRWDSLRLFTPARYDALAGMPFPAPAHSFPTKDEVADYLEAYATQFRLPVRTGVRVDRLWRDNGRFVMAAGDRRWQADNVVVAMSSFQVPRVPAFAPELDPGVIQLHAGNYRNSSQLQDGGVLVVGAGNSGAEIALEVAGRHPIWLAGKESGVVPFRIEGAAARFVFQPLLFRVVGHRVLTVDTPIGRKLRPRLISHAAPLVRVKPKDLAAAGIQRVPRVVGVRDGHPLLADQRVLEVANVIWCTGFVPDFSWIDLPVFGEDENEPTHRRGVVANQPGLYFVGLYFLYAMSSGFLPGVDRDAEHIVHAILAGPDRTPGRPGLTADNGIRHPMRSG
jgi:putative flavoprotein involved in K+ transport